jgi:hypothetical protein
MAALPTVGAIRGELAQNIDIRVVGSSVDIDVGEEFSVQIGVRNNLSYLDAPFRGVRLWVEPVPGFTEFADGGTGPVSFDLGDVQAGETASTTVQLRALGALPSSWWFNPEEPVVRAKVRANFDITDLFNNIWQNEYLNVQINP